MWPNHCSAAMLPNASMNRLQWAIEREVLALIGQGNLRGELGLFFTPVLMLWSGGYIGGHVWWQVIVPSNLAQLFGVIYPHYWYLLIHHAITIMRVWFIPHGKGNSCLLGGGTITLLHRWYQDGHRNRFPLKFFGIGSSDTLTESSHTLHGRFASGARLCKKSFVFVIWSNNSNT